MKILMAGIGVIFKIAVLTAILFIALLCLFCDKVLGKPIRVVMLLLAPLILTGCVYTSIPTPDGRRARTLRVLPFTKMETTDMLWANGTTNVHIRMNGYEGRVDSDAIEAGGDAASDIIGASARKAVTGQ